jgi:hypothetical protein
VIDVNATIEGYRTTTAKLFATRDLVEATLFPTPAYIVLTSCEMFYRYPEILRQVLGNTTAEEVGAECRKPGGQLNQRWVWTLGTQFLWGREFLIQLGEISPDERVEDMDALLSFARDVSRAYRGDRCWMGVENDGGNVPALDRPVVEQIESDLAELSGEAAAKVKRLNALLTTYTFLMGAESRKGMHANGPYPVGSVLSDETWGFNARHKLWIKDFSDLSPNRYSYSEGVPVEVKNVTLALVLEDVNVSVPPWGTHLMTDPEDYLDRVRAYAAYESDRGLVKLLSPADIDVLIEQLTEAQTLLYLRMADWDREQAVRAGTECYFKGNIEPVASFAGITPDIELGEVTDRLIDRVTDEQGADLLGGLSTRPWHPVGGSA